MIGRTLSHYKILEKLGSGGMGEVYKAQDTRLDRTVAIKVLPAHLSSDAERRQRFEREARAVSSLNHPHICTLHDFDTQDGVDFLIMEYIDGETLADRLAKGPLPLDRALRYAVEIADALDKAHRQGVVHRDLKPGNIMLNKSGAKLLDFGLAKFRDAAQSGSDMSALPTEAKPLTEKGAILGTYQYMAPEQLEGEEADNRTDIFAFGSVLYEMLTGKRAFEGKSQASLIGAIMNTEPPPVSSLEPMSPLVLDRVIKTCLAKDPDERWQSAGDVGHQLKWIAESASRPATEARTQASKNRERLAWTLSVLLAGFTAWSLLRPASRSDRAITRLEMSLQSGQSMRGLIAISPAGDRAAYCAQEGNGPAQLYIRSLNEYQARLVAGCDSTYGPFFSPDGEWVGFFDEGKLQRVAVAGGAPIAIVDALGYRGGSWGENDTIVYGQAGVGLLKVSAGGGKPQTILASEDDTIGYRQAFPQILPGGKTLLFTTWKSDPQFENRARIGVLSLEAGEWKIVLQGAECARFLNSGHLLYAAGESGLRAVRFDLASLEVSGNPVSLLDDVFYSFSSGRADFASSKAGTLAYVPGSLAARTLVWVDREGQERPILDEQGEYSYPSISSNGSKIVFRQRPDIWVFDLERRTRTRLSYGGNNLAPVWTPDGNDVVFTSPIEGNFEIYSTSASGSGEPHKMLERHETQYPMSWFPDGKALAFMNLSSVTGADIWMMPLEGESSPFLATPFEELAARFSPDGRLLAYISNESGRYEVYVIPYPGPGDRRTISTDGGTEPVWSHDGKELFYRNGDELIAVEIDADRGFSVGASHTLFRGAYLSASSSRAHYDVSPDGQEFLMVRLEPGSMPAQINIVTNWFQELERLVPTH